MEIEEVLDCVINFSAELAMSKEMAFRKVLDMNFDTNTFEDFDCCVIVTLPFNQSLEFNETGVFRCDADGTNMVSIGDIDYLTFDSFLSFFLDQCGKNHDYIEDNLYIVRGVEDDDIFSGEVENKTIIFEMKPRY